MGSGEGNCHRVKIDQDTVPLINTNQLLSVGYGGEHLLEAILLVWGQGLSYVDGVYHPSQENLVDKPNKVPCLYLL